MLWHRASQRVRSVGHQSRKHINQRVSKEVCEYFQQELMARHSSSIMSSLANSTGAVASTDLSLDPFLSGLTDHQRQESADSGLGMAVPRVGDGDGLFSIPHTPEDFLAGMDDRMDCSSEAGANIDSTDMAIGDNLDSTDDLVPSLQVTLLLLANNLQLDFDLKFKVTRKKIYLVSD